MKIRNILFAVVAVVALSACEEFFVINRAGQPIVFSASSGDDVHTKTAYSGEVVDGKERIDWVLGDEVMIYRYEYKLENGEPKSEDHKNKSYYIKGVHVGGQGGKDKTGDRKESHGTLATRNESDQFYWDSLATDVRYEFYSVYPASLGDMPKISYYSWERENNYRIEFSLSDSQPGKLEENMRQNAFMAAVAFANPYSAISDRGSVELKYYPMVTTLYVTFKNDSETQATVLKGMKLTSTDLHPENSGWNEYRVLTGAYKAKLQSNRFVVDCPGYVAPSGQPSTISLEFGEDVPLNPGDSVNCAFFLNPNQSYEAKYLELSVLTSEGWLPYTFGESSVSFQSCYKYNVKVNLSGAGTPIEPDEPVKPEPNPVELNDAIAELIFSVLLSNGGSGDSYNKLKDFWKKYYEYNSADDLNKGLWKDLEKARNAQLDGMADLLEEIFGDNLDVLFDYLGTLKEVVVPNGYKKLSADTLDLSIFKSAEHIRFHMPQDMTVYISGLHSLKSFTIIDGSNGNMSLIIEDCSIETIRQEASDGAKIKKLHLIRTPKFRDAVIKNMNLSEMEIYLEDCSTEVQNAYIEIENTNTKKTVDRVGNTSNVTVRP